MAPSFFESTLVLPVGFPAFGDRLPVSEAVRAVQMAATKQAAPLAKQQWSPSLPLPDILSSVRDLRCPGTDAHAMRRGSRLTKT